MKYLLSLLLAAAATPALGQHNHAAAEQLVTADPHAGHQMDEEADDPHAGHDMPQSPSGPSDPHAGHQMPSTSATDAHRAHAGHEPGIPDPPVAPPSAAALRGPDHAADAIFGAQAMAPARETVRKEHGDIKSGMILIDQLEAVMGKGKDGYAWEAQGWYGGDIDRLWFKTEGESSFGESPEHAEVQALWSRALDPWWNLQAGIRQDFGAGPDRTYAVVGVQGLAPYWFEMGGALFLSDKGDFTARIEAEYDQRLTQKLILQPAAELNFSAQDVPELGIGSGLSTAELGLRLRYQFVPEFAPYVGVRYERAFGDTADFRRARDEKAGGWNFLIGIRSWF
ncbi:MULTISPECIES: copper resistance protein B [Sphingobium]|jgi:copper resistance protein B|uniref:Autotransporter domain-containing protein n=1 Tax=Sphingobium yanoikuyae TaxID=13690 RepID=A0A084EIY5_SPHYA|nr:MULTISPECIES: copper resistance protein B [Sphingobium]KEZ17927.1 Copper resistance B [Sphingobium yanoikuyae]NBB40379.1 autotransporter domain-containing protein [Sphingobium yanoikuyae]OAH42567.1 copper resistance protein CopB [Sphingobium yanoikuyae]QGP80760.1 copper resistance protein B [Sphingobium sp. CAP-1]QHD66977.1 autotransporter domain-containing protein [Sphingobium yanoikuyae]